MKAQTETARFEPRWPVALTILAVILLVALLPARIVLVPSWVALGVGMAVLMPIIAVGLTRAQPSWLRLERAVTLLFFAITAIGTVVNLSNLINAIIHRSAEVTGLQLLTSGVAVWVINVLMFSLLYWQMDRGGPEARVNQMPTRTDWLFPQEGASAGHVPPDWRPRFVDYLYLSYSTATAFSTTDVMPLTHRAKMLMMLESAISLVTLVVVGARAINIFGS
jgi:uncharacterized membrane protein